MGQCAYWWTIDEDQWCDLTDNACSCEGSEAQCALSGSAISAALLEQERMTLAETAQRARRRRSAEEAS